MEKEKKTLFNHEIGNSNCFTTYLKSVKLLVILSKIQDKKKLISTQNMIIKISTRFQFHIIAAIVMSMNWCSIEQMRKPFFYRIVPLSYCNVHNKTQTCFTSPLFNYFLQIDFINKAMREEISDKLMNLPRLARALTKGSTETQCMHLMTT